MSNKYYYLVSSLPYLEFGKPSLLTREEFLSESRKWLSPPDFFMLSRLDIDEFDLETKDSDLVKEWKSFDLEFRKELAGIRKERKKSLLEGKPAKEILEEPDPLLLEIKIQKKRWEFLEEDEYKYHFDMNALILYFLKLQILEKLAIFEKEKGKEVFENLCEVTP